ncbi:MAG: chitobiase/beta-hexosaminidase C-terminal domain-containing protein, partial [Bacteroidales bacterium]|nr:chitobiase/beta-hexosaminidase C-terminal domain-containing protein [Bacteroidales bacterium]
MRVCAANANPDEGVSSISPITTIHYTVGETAPVPAPTLPASGKVAENSTVAVGWPNMPNDGFSYSIVYILDDPDFDFAQYKCADNSTCTSGPVVPTNQVYKDPIVITKNTTVTAITMRYTAGNEKIVDWSEKVTATYTVFTPFADMVPVLEPAKGYVKPGQELQCTVPEAVWEQNSRVFVLYVENDDAAVLESDYETLLKIAGNTPEIHAEAGVRADVNVPYKVAVAEYDAATKKVEWVRPMVISDNASAEIKFRARMAVMEEGDDEEYTLAYAKELTTTYYTVVPKPVFEPGHGLVTAGQEIGCTVPESFDWEQANGSAIVIYIENNDDLKLEEVPASDIVAILAPSTDQDPEQGVEPEQAYRLAACVQDEDGKPVYTWKIPVVLSENIDGTVSFRARLVMLTQDEDGPVATFSDEVKAYYYTALPAPRFANAGEVLQSDALNVEFPAEVDLAYYLDQAFILYVENDATAELTYDGTMGELQALAQGGSPALPDDTEEEEGGVPALSAKAGLAYKVAVYDMLEGWNPAVFLTTLGQVNVRARLAVGTNMEGALIYSDEFTAAYTVKERPLPNKPAFVVDGKEVAGDKSEVKKGAALGFKSGYEDNDDYIVCYVINGKDEDFANATMQEIAMGTSPVKMYEPDIAALTVEEAQTVKAATVQELASGDLWWSEIVTVAFTLAPETVAKPTFSVAAGNVEKGTKVTIACATEGAAIYYTVDGSVPTEKSTPYKEAIEITGKVTIKAIAVKGDVKSEVAEATYALLANENEELMGVNVYPNPSDGVFS